jgi:hypothetical protein
MNKTKPKARNLIKEVKKLGIKVSTLKNNKYKNLSKKQFIPSKRNQLSVVQPENVNVNKLTPAKMYKQLQMYQDCYGRALLLPESARNAKIPSLFPQETASIHKHWTIPVTCTAGGLMAGMYDPTLLSDTTSLYSQLYIDTSSTLTLTSADTVGGAINIAMSSGLPINVYSQFRLVSCSITLVPQMSITNAQGTIGGGIYLSATGITPNAVGTTIHYAGDNLSVSSNIDNLPYSTYANVTALESLRMIYFPADPLFEGYCTVNASKSSTYQGSSFIFAWYITGAPTSAKFNVEIYANYEAFPYIGTDSYIPVSSYKGNESTSEVIKKITSDNKLVAMSGAHVSEDLWRMDEYEKNEDEFGYLNKTMAFIKDYGKPLLDIGASFF